MSGDLWLDSYERWWRVTGNPLFCWEAMNHCLNADPPRPVPTWCLPYLGEAARNLTTMAWGRDFRRDAPLPPGRALSVVPEAFGLGKQGQKSAFKRYAEDARLMRDYNRGEAVDHSYREVGGEMHKNPVGPERARQLKRQAKRLLGDKNFHPKFLSPPDKLSPEPSNAPGLGG